MSGSTLLVNGFYAGAVGHAVEMLHRALGYHLADPQRRVSLLLNADTATEIAGLAPFLDGSFTVRHPIVETCGNMRASDLAFARVPAGWDVVVDDHRRGEAWQTDVFPGLGEYYAASDRRLRAREVRVVHGDPRVPYRPGGQLRLGVPDCARVAAERRLAAGEGGERRPVIVVMLSGSSERARYPSVRSWLTIMDALTRLDCGPRLVLLGKSIQDGRTRSTLNPGELRELLAHRSAPLDAFDLPFVDQVAILQAADLFLAPHTGFGLVALAAGTPWLSISGGPWFEWFFNRVAFRSVLPDTHRYPSFTLTGDLDQIEDEGPRQPAMSYQRIREDLDRICLAAKELLAGEVSYEQAMRDYVPALVDALDGDRSRVFSNDGLHVPYLP